MKVNRQDLLGQLDAVSAGLSQKEIIEQSSCFVFQDKQVITYNDEVACRMACNIGVTGAVQAAPLINLLRKLVEDVVTITPEDGELVVKGKRRSAGVRMESEVLLPVGAVDEPKKFKPLHEKFGMGVGIVQNCASKDITNFALTCIHLHPDFVEACDNYQLSRFPVKTGLKRSVLVRGSAMRHVVALGMTHVSETKNWVHFKNADGLVVSCRKYTEDFADLTESLAVEGSTMTIPKGLADAADKAEVFSAENSDNTNITVNLTKGKVVVSGRGSSGWYKETKKVAYDGPPVSFMIAPKLLIELSRKHNTCTVSGDRLKVDTEGWEYVTVLGVIADEASA